MLSLLPILCLTQQPPVAITNLEPGEIVRTPVVVLEGTAQDDTVAVGPSWDKAVRFPVANGHWQGFTELKPGKNMVLLQAGSGTMKFLIEYKPMTTPYKVVTLFIKGSDGKDTYYSTRPGDRFPIRDKLDVAMKLLQAASAETMYRNGYGRRTFNLELEKDGKIKLHTIALPKTEAEMKAMKDVDAWGYMYGVINPMFDDHLVHWCGMLGYTTFNKEATKIEGHMALGGGAQALFGGASMEWWPSSFKEVPQVFADTYALDPASTFEDSAYRRTVWANVSTAWGAMLHEMGHTFGLPHSADRYSVMSRGFDHFNRWFTAVEPPTARETKSKTPGPEERMRWDKYSAAKLNLNPWFQADGRQIAQAEGPKITIGGDEIIISSAAGIRLWGADRDDTPAVFEELKVPQRSVKLSRSELRKRLGTDKEFRFTALDAEGRQTDAEDKPAGGTGSSLAPRNSP